MCAGARTSTANGRVEAKCIHYQVRATQIYSVFTNKYSTQTHQPLSFCNLYIVVSVVLIREFVMGQSYGNCLAVSYRYCRFFFLLFADPFFFIQFHERAPYVALVKNRH
jgi:hypothetical protein